jgi:hypothetical protein
VKSNHRGWILGGIGAFLVILLAIVWIVLPNKFAAKGYATIFFLILVIFFFPPFIWIGARKKLAGMLIPGVVLAVEEISLFAVFLLNQVNLSVFSLLMFPVSVGLGIMMAAWIGDWRPKVFKVGLWIAGVGLALFVLLGILLTIIGL